MFLPKKTRVWNRDYPSLVTINGRGKDRPPNGLGDKFPDLWFNDLVQAQAIRASFLLESNAGFDAYALPILLVNKMMTRSCYSPLSCLLERGLFKPEQGEVQKAGQRGAKYAAAVGTRLLVKVHCLADKVDRVGRQQNHPLDRLDECIDFVSEASDRIGKVVDELNNCIDAQDLQIEQLATMANDLIRKVENQANEIKGLKWGKEEHRKVINNLTAKLITVEECLEDVQKKAFPRVREDNLLVIDDLL
jgi:hypothetical protein